MIWLFAILAALPARAGLLDWCEGWLVAPDPYEYEQTPQDILCRKLAQLEIRERWGKLSKPDASDLRVLRGELTKRAAIAEVLGSPAPACP